MLQSVHPDVNSVDEVEARSPYHIIDRPGLRPEEMVEILCELIEKALPMETRFITIEPNLASYILDTWNKENRRPRVTRIRDYAVAMKAGRFIDTAETMSFSRDRLLNGQNRLFACVKADCVFKALVAFGVPNDVFPYIDNPGIRNAADTFFIHGVETPRFASAAMQWIVNYETGRLSKGTASKNCGLDRAQLYEEYLKHSDIDDSIWVGELFKANKLALPAAMIAMHHLCKRKSAFQANNFFSWVGQSLGFPNDQHPAYVLHNRLMTNLASRDRLHHFYVAGLVVKAWNAMRNEKTLKQLKIASDESFPEIL